ncbi:MAG: class I SAM-dependent methyltransferase [Pyrinomonadaceae bacterium]|nr:class I SAM-dependent methyltransferase [Pyrinomonadaceae bacterium]
MLKTFAKSILPKVVWNGLRSRFSPNRPDYFSSKSIQETFTEIYRKNLWGGDQGHLCSGSGSNLEASQVYVEAIQSLFEKHPPKVVVDIGCGDFRVASQIVRPTFQYIGIDAVPDVIEHHQKNFANHHISFVKMDATNEKLPDGDICLIRQVLQHLSNAEINAIISKCRMYKGIVVTEHFPDTNPAFKPNLDMVHGAGTRLSLNSAVCLNEPPFNLKQPIELAIYAEKDGSTIRTYYFPNSDHLTEY